MIRKKSNRRRLNFQNLERRNLLAAHLSELLVDSLFGNDDTTQMIELRGEPGATLGNGTYLVIAEEQSQNYGQIHGIFDLSGQSFGSNGYLVLLQQDSPHFPESGASVLQSTSPGFGGLPGGIYTDSHALSDRIDFIIGANGYFLIESSVAPQLGDLIDANENSIPDPEESGTWTVLDSISLHPFVGRGERAMGQIVFAEVGATDPEIETRPGAPMIPTAGFGYAGRVGETVGSDELDWIASTVQNEADSGDPESWALADNLFGESTQFAFAGRDLDHVGGPNFVGGAHGFVTDSSAQPVAGVEIFADTNNNGMRDNLTYVFDPDVIVEQVNNEFGPQSTYPLINSFPGATVTKFALDSFAAQSVTAERERDFPDTLNNHIFATGGIDWFTENGVLRFDFYEPINSASIVSIGSDSPLSPVIGRLEAYDRDGNLLAAQNGSRIMDSERTVIELATGADNISYLFAFAEEDESHDGGPFGRFDRLIFSQHEIAATTDSEGYYEIENLFPDSYQIRPVQSNFLATPVPLEVTRYEHVNANFGLGDNRAPTIDDGEFNLSDDAPGGSIVGSLVASDPDGDALSYRFDGVVDDFEIDPETGVIRVSQDAQLDAMATPQITLTVVVEDSGGLSASATATINLTAATVNSPPSITTDTLSVQENQGGLLGTLVVNDPDTDQNHTFELLGGTGADFVQVLNNGQVYSRSGVPLDYEAGDSYLIEVKVTDSGTPPLSQTKVIGIQLSDVNEPPTLSTQPIVLNENATGVLGNLSATDPDNGQSLTYSLLGGTGADVVDISPSGEITLKAGQQLDYETQDSYTLLVNVSDNGTPVRTGGGIIDMIINDVDEAPRFKSGVDPQSVLSGERFMLSLPTDLIDDPDEIGWTLDADVDGESLPGWLKWDADNRVISGIPSSFYVGSLEIDLHVSPAGDPEVVISTSFELDVQISAFPLHNAASVFDVNGDNDVTPLDALQVIDFIARVADPQINDQTRVNAFFDTTRDNEVTPLDALQIINQIAREQAGGEAVEPSAPQLVPAAAEDHDEAIEAWLAESTLF